jgi:hypothetical protein
VAFRVSVPEETLPVSREVQRIRVRVRVEVQFDIAIHNINFNG